jgi:hypothetical protein
MASRHNATSLPTTSRGGFIADQIELRPARRQVAHPDADLLNAWDDVIVQFRKFCADKSHLDDEERAAEELADRKLSAAEDHFGTMPATTLAGVLAKLIHLSRYALGGHPISDAIRGAQVPKLQMYADEPDGVTKMFLALIADVERMAGREQARAAGEWSNRDVPASPRDVVLALPMTAVEDPVVVAFAGWRSAHQQKNVMIDASERDLTDEEKAPFNERIVAAEAIIEGKLPATLDGMIARLRYLFAITGDHVTHFAIVDDTVPDPRKLDAAHVLFWRHLGELDLLAAQQPLAPTPTSDVRLVALAEVCRRLLAIEKVADAIGENFMWDALGRMSCPMLDELRDTPARTAVGIAAKLRAMDGFEVFSADGGGTTLEGDYFGHWKGELLRDAERLAGLSLTEISREQHDGAGSFSLAAE